MNESLIISVLLKECANAGSQRAWAAAKGLSAQYVHDVLAGRRLPGAKILAALGYERVVAYQVTSKRKVNRQKATKGQANERLPR